MIRRVVVPDTIDQNIENAKEMAERLDPILERIKGLPVREGAYIYLYFIEGWTYREIAESVHLSVERIRQIANRGLRRLRRDVEYGRL